VQVLHVFFEFCASALAGAVQDKGWHRSCPLRRQPCGFLLILLMNRANRYFFFQALLALGACGGTFVGWLCTGAGTGDGAGVEAQLQAGAAGWTAWAEVVCESFISWSLIPLLLTLRIAENRAWHVKGIRHATAVISCASDSG